MKARDRMTNVRASLSAIRTGYKNVLKCSSGGSEGISHKVVKFWIANYCWENGLTFWTEASFSNGGRADVLIGDWKLALEVLNTEDLKKFETKEYPVPTIPLPSTMKGLEVVALLDEIARFNASEECIARESKLLKDAIARMPSCKSSTSRISPSTTSS